MIENKKAFLSGRLTGKRTLENELNSIINPDEYEKFLIEYTNLKFEILTDNEIVFLSDNQEFKNKVSIIEESEYISLSINENFTRLYITTDSRKTFVIFINQIDAILISNLISKEKPTKFLLNSFPFIKWCNEKKIDIRNIYDIQTYIKILTNNIDLEKTSNEYIKQYTNKEIIEGDSELNNIILGNFIYEFGKYLENYINKFDLVDMCKLINENAYFESLNIDSEGNSKIIFSYIELEEVIKEISKKELESCMDKEYLLSPLGRVALKFNRNEEELIKEIYLEDLEMLILNELYNNNIYPKVLGDNLYKITCKFKNFNNISSLVIAILTDVFYNLFEEKIKIKLECELE